MGQRRVRWIGLVGVAALVAGATAIGVSSGLDQHRAAAAANEGEASCQMPGVAGPVKHVVELTFDNVHLASDNPNVPSDLQQMPNLLDFIENNGVMLSDNHTPLIAHTADDILTALTGLYGATHGQPVANSYRTFNPDGTASKSSSFAYWTDPVTGSSTDTAPTMDDNGRVTPAPWAPFTRAGCDVGAFGTANMEIENPATDLPVIYGKGSPEYQQYAADKDPFKDQEVADYEGIAIHCAQAADSACSRSNRAVTDALPDEPGGYSGFQGLFGNKYVAPVIGGTGAGGVMIDDLGGTPLTDPFTGTPGFPGFDPTASQTLGYVAAMQEHGIPVTYGYIEDAHQNYATGTAAGPGDSAHEANLQADDAAFGAFFQRLQSDGITTKNTLFLITADEGDHFAGTSSPSPTSCDGVTTFCTFPQGTIGELQTTINGLLSNAGDTQPTYSLQADSAPNFYVQNSARTGPALRDDPGVRSLEHDLAGLTLPDPYTSAGSAALTHHLADGVEEQILHMVTADPLRTPTFTDFANPDFFVQTSSNGTCPKPTSTETGTADSCVLINPAFAWDHGDVSPDINTTWLGLIGPGVANLGVDNSTWADHTDIRPTLMALTGLTDDYTHDGRVLYEDLAAPAQPKPDGGSSGEARAGSSSFLALGQAYKQLDSAVGQFGQYTLNASTYAIENTDESTYNSVENQLTQLGGQRDSLATQIISVLESVEFHGATIDQAQDNSLVQQANNLIAEAQALPGN